VTYSHVFAKTGEVLSKINELIKNKLKPAFLSILPPYLRFTEEVL